MMEKEERIDNKRLSDMSLARFLCCNGRNWCPSDRAVLHLPPEVVFYQLAISLELTLKAAVTAAGMSDDENRILVRHDLAKALCLAMVAGLPAPSVAMDRLISLVHPHYMMGSFRRMTGRPWPADFVSDACRAVLDLNDFVLAVTDGRPDVPG